MDHDGDSGSRQPRERGSWWRMLRIALVALWVVWAALSWWAAPRQADVAEARADLSAGRVMSYQWADSWDADAIDGWNSPERPRLRSSGTQGPMFVWRTPDWRIHYAMTGVDSTEFTLDDSVDATRFSDPEAASVDQAVHAAGLRTGAVDDGPVWPILLAITIVMALTFLGVLINGPAPVTGTRWCWFWLVSGAPLGLGLLYWLARERPWSATVVARRGTSGVDGRRRWYVGFIGGILASLAVSLLVYLLHDLLGDTLVPHPGS
jgi:hypothetical protein